MSNSQYWTLLTRAGREKVLAAIANKHTVKISEFAVGDGQITHTSDDLSNLKYRSHTSSLKQLTNNNALIEVVGVVPATEGGFYVREAAFYTDDGQAFAIINYPETYKPAAADNAAAELGIKAVIDVVNAQVISEKIDPSVIYATKEWVSDQVDHSELSVLTKVGKNWTFDNGTSTTVNINANDTGLAALNVCSGTSDAQTTGRVYVGQSLRHGGGIEYNGNNNPVTTGAGADYVTLFRRSQGQLHWTAKNLHSNNDWEFRGAVKSPNFIEGGTSLKDKYHGKSDKLARFESSLIDATGQDFNIRNKRALVGFEGKLIINYASDWSHVDANGTWRFTGNIERNSHNSGYLVGSYNNIGPNETKTNPIYTIGSNYQPSETELSSMYGIGYTHGNASFVPDGAGWGMYVAADGDARIFLDASHGRVHTTGDVYEAGTKLSDKYLGKTAKAVDAAKLEGKTKAQVVSEARTNLVVYKPTPTNGRNFLSDAAWVVSYANGSNTNIDHIWYDDSTIHGFEGAYHACADSTFKAEGNAAFYAGGFFENGTKLQDKYHPKSDKLARFENSFIDINYGGQDLKIRSKRALVGSVNELSINHGSDWQNVRASGKWQFTDSINTNGDITVTKNNPWLTLDSAGVGDIHNEQAAGISLGENGRGGGASLHLSYTGDGYSYIGMGGLGSDNIADKWVMKMQYQSTWVWFRSALLIGDGNTVLSKGSNNSLKIKTNHGYVDIGPQNSGHCHYATSLSNHWFNKEIRVQGEIYASSGYNKRVYHQGYKPSAADVGAFQRHSGQTPTVNKDGFTTIAKVLGSSLASSINLQLKGTAGSTVVNVNAAILVNHHQDIVIDSMCGGYTTIQLKVISNNNEQYLIEAKLLSGNPLSLRCDILSYTNDDVSIGSYDTAGFTYEHVHTVKRFGRQLSSSGATGMQINGHEVAHAGNISSYAEKRTVKASGTLTANSKNHLTATATFTLPDVTNLSEGTTVVASKAMAVTPTIKTHGAEHIAMMRGTTMLTDTSVLFDRHCTLTFILNSEKNWEMQ
ncbi:phage tail protein [Pseudoalteromonas aurantia]|uniref:Phage tail fibre protein N-terminal domain-containing protein n=1 Tax=Pseudoalteromonas aurantia TaxID=43654 RepID=A0A5S3V1C2_9GAMM|nr:phage tail protein [Pseudoalteromonas aurantia]TMO64197.1 hypothetical protein CWC19_18510 [Pseudoalteromonas aurantia]TMO70053.1 hypothetical protein CWC20_19910 [Pseudoalteromonas aurantia]